MNNKMKMKIKSIPGAYPIIRALNRTLGRHLRIAKAMPEMRRLNGELNERISVLEPGRPRVWYFGVPTHSNLGDQAQKFVILDWLERKFPAYEVVEIPSNAFNGGPEATMALIKDVTSSDDLVFMQSGHTMDGIHPDETAHRLAPLSLPENRIIFFPTSISFNGKAGMEKDRRCINQHERILFLARDPVSYAKAKDLYPKVDVRLYPDVVTSLIGRYSFKEKRNGILLCTRNDGEKLYSYGEIDALASKLTVIDKLDRSDTTVDWDDVDFSSAEAWARIEDVFASYARYRCVVTDRYHGTIFARIVGTPVVVLKTTDHKVVSGAKWFEEAEDGGVAIADDLGAVFTLVQDMLDEYPSGVDAPTFSTRMYEKELPRLVMGM